MSDDTLADHNKTVAETEQTILDLFYPGPSSVKVERSRQFSKNDQCSILSINRGPGLLLCDRDLAITVFDLINELKCTTKSLK